MFEFSAPAATIHSLSSRTIRALKLSKRLAPHTRLTVEEPGTVRLSVPAGIAWLEVSAPASVTAGGSAVVPGRFGAGAEFLDGRCKYRCTDGVLKMESEFGASRSRPVGKPDSVAAPPLPQTALCKISAESLRKVLTILAPTVGALAEFSLGQSRAGDRDRMCVVEHDELSSAWSLPAPLLPLVLELLTGQDGEVEIRGNEARQGLVLKNACIHWPKQTPTLGAAEPVGLEAAGTVLLDGAQLRTAAKTHQPGRTSTGTSRFILEPAGLILVSTLKIGDSSRSAPLECGAADIESGFFDCLALCKAIGRTKAATLHVRIAPTLLSITEQRDGLVIHRLLRGHR